MTVPINLTIFVVWAISALIEYAEYIYLWQIKEYRLDKFKDFVASEQGRRYWMRPMLLLKVTAAVLVFMLPFDNTLLIKRILLALLYIDVIAALVRFSKNRLRTPVRTKKALLLIVSALLLEGLLFVYQSDWSALFLLIMVRFGIASFAVYLFSFPTNALKRRYVKKATLKLAQYKDLTVIGVTGSYGKSSTKRIIAHVLSTRLNVVATPKNINTEIGVAQFVLKTDFQGIDVFVVEMGAYTKGEIKLICEMVKPEIGVLTAINEQHLKLFGSVQNIQTAKYELLRSLPKKGIAITNSDNKWCREKLNELNCQVRTFGIDEEFQPTVLIQDIENTQKGTRVQFTGRRGIGEGLIPLPGSYHIFNVVPAAIISNDLGFAKQDFWDAIATLPRSVASIQIHKFGKAILLDDSYNSNPTGFHAALEVLATYKKRYKIVVTRGMEELADRSDLLHDRVAGDIAFMADELIIISRDHEAQLRHGVVSDKYKTVVHTILERADLRNYLVSKKDEEVAILLENRLPMDVYEAVMEHTVPQDI